MKPEIETRSGILVDLVQPKQEQIHFKDIAWSLSRAPRFNGHTLGEHPYSVAQHSVWVAYVAQHYLKASPTVTLLALLHDAHEAYTGDITTPLKTISTLAGSIRDIENRLQQIINQKLVGIDANQFHASIIKEADRYALAVEAKHLMVSRGEGWACTKDVPDELFSVFWKPLPTQEAYELFWMARNYIDSDIKLEELWRSI